jgi:multidrug efflux pump subunit AcrA (membrane-fusion protein)
MRCSLIARCSSLLRLWRLPNLKSVVKCCLVTPCLVAGILVGLVGAQERSLQLPPRLPGGSLGSSPGPDRGGEQRGLPPASALNPVDNPTGTPNSDSRSLPALPTAQPMRGAAGVGTGSVGAVPSGSQTAGLAGSSQGNAADGVALEPSTYRSRISIQGSVVRLDVCLVKVIEKIELPAREAGVLRALAVREGNLVDANSLLAKVDDHQAVTELESAKRRLEASQLKISSDIGIRYAQAAKETAWKAFRREDTLVRRNAGTEAKRDELQLAAIQADLQYEKAQHDFNVDQKAVKLDELQVQKAQQLLDRHDIFSPWAGVVTQVLKRQGE